MFANTYSRSNNDQPMLWRASQSDNSTFPRNNESIRDEEDEVEEEEDEDEEMWMDADSHASDYEAERRNYEQEEESEGSQVVESDSEPDPEEAQRAKLRKQIIAIQSDSSLAPMEKSKRIQALMTTQWQAAKNSQNLSSVVGNVGGVASTLQDSEPTEDDKKRTYHDEDSHTLGCKHYQRHAKLKANCCGKWYTCRFCHDEDNDHAIIRNQTKTMMCMHCTTVQPAAQYCINPQCLEKLAVYYCNDCKLWDDDRRKSIYHCEDCGICRIGKGLGKDFFHCKKCNVCMAITLQDNHKCIERNLECDCPICGEYMFTSTTTVIFMPCGHCIHYKCHEEYIQTSYQCPTCWKSLGDMRSYFERIDEVLSQQKMPPEYEDFISLILCNDCEKKSHAKYNFLYHKCGECGSYNTKVIQTFQRDPSSTTTTSPTGVVPVGTTAQEMLLQEVENARGGTAVDRQASERGAEGTEQMRTGDDGPISNTRNRTGSNASSQHRLSIVSMPDGTSVSSSQPSNSRSSVDSMTLSTIPDGSGHENE